MPNKNITKIALFVILALFCSAVSLACGLAASGGTAPEHDTADFDPPVKTGSLRSPDLQEASGVAASKCQPNVYWTHNDSGGGAFLYAIDETGGHLGTWHVSGAKNRDWEDIAEFKDPNGKCFILIGDIGDNDLKNEELLVYRVAEPIAGDSSRGSSKSSPLETSPSEILTFDYPDRRHNAETLLVHPKTGEIYLLTKSKKEPVSVFKLKPQFSGPRQTAVLVAQFTVPAVPNGLLTGGDIAPDGQRVILCDYVYGYEMSVPAGANFDDIWKQRPLRFDLGDRGVGEAVTYTPAGDAALAISEEPNTPVFLVKRNDKKTPEQ